MPDPSGQVNDPIAWLKEHVLASVISGAILLILGTLVTIFIVDKVKDDAKPATTVINRGGGVVAPTHKIPEPKTPVEEAASRTMWTEPPDTFKSANDASGDTASVLGGDVSAYTPRKLFEDPELYGDEDAYIVGRIVSQRARDGANGIDREYRIVGKDREYDAYIGVGGFSFESTGDVVYALGRVAAVGQTTTPSGRRIQTVYFYAPGSETGSVASAGSDAIRAAAKGLRPTSRRTSGGGTGSGSLLFP